MSVYKVRQTTACGTPYTVGKAPTSRGAIKIAEMHRHVTGKRPQILYRGKVQAY